MEIECEWAYIHYLSFFLAMVPDAWCVYFLAQITGFSEQDETTSYVTNRDRKRTIMCMTFKT